jgi:hypothetical protein
VDGKCFPRQKVLDKAKNIGYISAVFDFEKARKPAPDKGFRYIDCIGATKHSCVPDPWLTGLLQNPQVREIMVAERQPMACPSRAIQPVKEQTP